MRLKTFKSMIEAIVEIHDISYEKEKILEKAFGGDTQIATNETGMFMDKLIKILVNDMVKDKTEKAVEEGIDWIDYLIYENLLSDKYDAKKESIFIKDKKTGKEIGYPVTEKVIWKILKKKI